MSLIEQIDSLSQEVINHFSPLSETQLNWKPSPSQWSIAQCLDHLIVSNSTYFPIFDSLLAARYQESLWEKTSPLSNYFGKMMAKTLGPESQKKFEAPGIFEPASSPIDKSIIDRFQKHQQQLKKYYEQLEKLETEKIRISSPVTKLVTYNLQHGLEIIVGHEQRHINQALDVLHHPNFPK